MPDTYPQVRISPEAHAHLMRLLPFIRKQRGYSVPMTAVASEAILSIPLPTRNGNGKKPVIVTGDISGVAAGGSAGESES